MKVVFISIRSKNMLNSGGKQCSIRNFEAIQSYFGKDNVEFISFQQQIKHGNLKYILLRLRNFIFCRYHNESFFNERNLIDSINKFDAVFLDNSIFGILAKKIRQKYKNIKIISFFHNIESYHIRASHQYTNNFLEKIIRKFIVFKNEFWMCKYSDAIIALTLRDAKLIEELYNKKVTAIIPISFPNKRIDFSKGKKSSIPVALFLGTTFFGNIHGIKWFIEKVLPFVNINLKVVGKGMDKINLPKNERLEVFGYVENLDECMQKADFMVYPIFIGGGMKVKTCEALMYGKNIIGTGEAFMGYDVDFEKVGAKCETEEEFINAINDFSYKFTNKFNGYSRKIFLEKYTDEIVFEQFAKVFRKILEV
jgi:hypothetical protein